MNGAADGGGEATPHPFWKLLMRIHASQLHAFLVPGADLARVHGLDPKRAGLRIAETPRHANVLLLIGPLPFALRRAAVVAWHQMPSPRAVLSVDIDDASGLPHPDVSVAGRHADLVRGLAEVALALQRSRSAPRRHAIHKGMQHEGMQHEGMQHEGMQHEGMQHGGMQHEGMQHGGMQHGGMQHGGGMSMAAMTQSMPRGRDGLAMERMHAHFGPLFPGLPGGLALDLELDGDSVANAQLGAGLMRCDPRGSNLAGLADFLARQQPLSPIAYRILAWRAQESISGEIPRPDVVRGRVAALEIERARSHLGWLALLGMLLGDANLERRAAALQLATADGALRPLRDEVSVLTRRLSQSRLFRRRLDGIGSPPSGDAHGTGPVARAAGKESDVRTREGAYAAFDFKPVLEKGDDAFARACVRLLETQQSLGILLAAGEQAVDLAPSSTATDGSGAAEVETPRGAARLSLTVEEGKIRAFSLETPSPMAARLVAPICQGHELADALVAVASVDLSPWEIPA